MEKAAKRKMFLLVLIASAVFTCVPHVASSNALEISKPRAEFKTESVQNRVSESLFYSVKRDRNYDRFEGIASESSVAPNRGLSGQTFSQAKKTLTSASDAYKGSTRLGHALSKHAGRNPQIWGKISRSPRTYHAQAMKHLREIYRAPGEFKRVTNPNGIKFLEKMLPDGRGIRLQLDHVFKGFID